MENNHYVVSLHEAKKDAEQYLNLKSSLNSVQDYKNLTEDELFEINNTIISMLMFLVRRDNEDLEIYIQSFFGLPDELHYGFFNLFSDEFSPKAFESLIGKVDDFMKSREEFNAQLKEEKSLFELQGVRAAMLIKTLEAHFEVEHQNFENALSLFLKLNKIDIEGEIKYAGFIGLLYVVLKKYKEFDELDKTCEYEDTLLDYILALYLYKTEKDESNAIEALREAILENPLVIEILKALDSDENNIQNYNSKSVQEAQLIVKTIAVLFDSQKLVEWFVKNSAEVFAEIAEDDEMQEMIQKHYTDDDLEEETMDMDDDEDDDLENDEDGKIIKLFDK